MCASAAARANPCTHVYSRARSCELLRTSQRSCGRTSARGQPSVAPRDCHTATSPCHQLRPAPPPRGKRRQSMWNGTAVVRQIARLKWQSDPPNPPRRRRLTARRARPCGEHPRSQAGHGRLPKHRVHRQRVERPAHAGDGLCAQPRRAPHSNLLCPPRPWPRGAHPERHVSNGAASGSALLAEKTRLQSAGHNLSGAHLATWALRGRGWVPMIRGNECTWVC